MEDISEAPAFQCVSLLWAHIQPLIRLSFHRRAVLCSPFFTEVDFEKDCYWRPDVCRESQHPADCLRC